MLGLMGFILHSFIRFHTILCFIILYFTMYYYTILRHCIPSYDILYCIILYQTLLYCTTLLCPTRSYYTIPHYSVLHTILHYPPTQSVHLSTSRISITWELVRIAEPRSDLLNQNLLFSKSSGWFKCILKFERPSYALPCYTKKQCGTVSSTQTLQPDCLRFKSQRCYLLGPNNLIWVCFSFPSCKTVSV